MTNLSTSSMTLIFTLVLSANSSLLHDGVVYCQTDSISILHEIPTWDGYEESIVSISSPFLISPEEILFCDYRDHRVVRLDLANESLTGIGREGEGPGEFLYPSDLTVWSDGSFVVYDWQQFRISLFNSDGSFNTSMRLEIAKQGSPKLTILENGHIALVLGNLFKDDLFSNQVILIPPQLSNITKFAAPCEPTEASNENPFKSDFCRRTIAPGSNNTILVGYSDDYRIRRYSFSGELLKDWGSLDSEFKPTIFRMAEDRPIMFSRHYNGLDYLCEIEGKGFAVGLHNVWISQGGGSVYRESGMLDLRAQDGHLLHRIPIPNNMKIGHIKVIKEQLFVLAYHTGINEFPTMKIYSVALDEVFN